MLTGYTLAITGEHRGFDCLLDRRFVPGGDFAYLFGLQAFLCPFNLEFHLGVLIQHFEALF